jgi:hypothetical protein
MSRSNLMKFVIKGFPKVEQWSLREQEQLERRLRAELERGESVDVGKFVAALHRASRQGLRIGRDPFRLESREQRSTEDGLFRGAANIIDLLLEPDDAESTIGDLAERYRLRVETNPAHAKRWLIVQVGWLAFGRAMELLARFSAARAGK